MQFISEHSVSNHSLLLDTKLQLILLPASKSYGALDQFFRVLFKVAQDPNTVIYPKHGPLLFPMVSHFGGRRVTVTWTGAGGVQTAKAFRQQSSWSGKESAQGCLPKRLLGRPD